MYEKEEEMLNQSREQLEQLAIPEQQINDAIQRGIWEANSKRRKRKKTFWTLSVAAILMLTFITSIRVSPAFANVVASLPGMERFVDIIQFDKGLEAIIENEYYEPLGVSQVKDNMTFTIDGIILDETGMEIFYTLEAPFSIEDIPYGEIEVWNDGRNLSEDSSYSFGYYGEKTNRIVERFSFTFGEVKQFPSQQFELIFQLENEKKTTFNIPFTLKNKLQQGKVYALNQEVEMDGQKMLLKDITVYPLRVAVKIVFDEQNNMEILQFEDMRLEDENGEVWSSIQNGTSGFGGIENKERTYFLQSNYFKKPKELFIKMDKVQALPKEESYLLVDFGKKKILKQPSIGKVEVTNIESNSLTVKYLPIRENHSYSLFSQGKNRNGGVVDIPSQSMRGDGEHEYSEIIVDAADIINPVRIDFIAYPNYLDGSMSIQIK
ncbi:DUF4179 domain-containing protein [Psychrobacillus sp. NPDC093180]|uniref:DUF4179 domain-containing protein n=1 Tax=Psychrobacillus sp. NPDC093180 TaxID=3364489 RepID=UPI00380A1895